MTPLAALLARRIRMTGPLTVADYMIDCLTHPEHGYYTARDPLGARGDFTTAPEISQMFGELVGLSLAEAWRAQGCAAPAILAEPGPGRGTLMADILRAAAPMPGFGKAIRVHLVEASPFLRARQSDRLDAVSPVWHDRLADLPDGPLFLVANEFLDALPARQFIRSGEGWAERVVGLTPDGTLTFGLAPPAPLSALAHRLDDTREGDLVEYAPAREAAVAEIATRIARHGGAALLVDYGSWRSRGDTLQAVRAHGKVDPLGCPGEADLTIHVEFEALARAATAAGAAHTAAVPQGVFLERLGITARAQALARRLSGPALDAHVAAHRRLTHPDEMGNLFRVMAIHPKDTVPPPGLGT